MLQLPENFESYNQARKNGFLKMKELKDAGQRIVGTFCSFVPTELVEAAGGTVVSLYFIRILSQKTGRTVTTHPMARYAGALGAALAAAKQKTIDWRIV